MVAVEFPKPNGHPQLVVTSKKAFLMDAHVQSQVILSIKFSKEGQCVEETYDAWTLVADDVDVYCYYSDERVRGVWHVYKRPQESQEKTVLVLDHGYTPVETKNVHVNTIIVCVAVFILFFSISSSSIRLARDDITNLDRRLDGLWNQIDSIQNTVFEMYNKLYPIENRGPTGPTRPDYPNMPPGPDGPLGEENPFIKKELKVLKPGTELKSGDVFEFGHGYKLDFDQCSITILRPVGHGIASVGVISAIGFDNCVLAMQRDGNLVLYHTEKSALWASKNEIGKLCPKGITLTQEGGIICAE